MMAARMTITTTTNMITRFLVQWKGFFSVGGESSVVVGLDVCFEGNLGGSDSRLDAPSM